MVVVLKGLNLGRSLTAKGLEEILDGIRVAVFWREVDHRVLRPLLAAPHPASTDRPPQGDGDH